MEHNRPADRSRQRARRLRRARGLALGAALAAAALPASANSNLGVAGGVFVPYEGGVGYAIHAQYLYAIQRFRVGGEIGFRDFDARILDVDDVSVRTIALRPLVHYAIAEGPLSPYVGAGIAFDINVVDEDKIERARPGIDVFNEVGLGIGLFALLGLELRAADSLALFAEARAGGDVQLTDDGDLGAESLGGFEGIAGLRLRFGGGRAGDARD